MRRLAVLVATAGGVGYAPVAPGTFGSAVGVVLYMLARGWPTSAQCVLVTALAAVGIWAGGVAAVHFGREDPGPVVIDEVVGQFITLFAAGQQAWSVVLGFLLFRALDVVKPWPARSFERFPGGYGIMADDVMAGIYGFLALRVIRIAGLG